jgi:hypothetical protein
MLSSYLSVITRRASVRVLTLLLLRNPVELAILSTLFTKGFEEGSLFSQKILYISYDSCPVLRNGDVR